MRELLSVGTILGLSNILIGLVGIIRNKFLAEITGTYGVGIYTQIITFILLVSSLSSMGLASGVAKYIPNYLSINNIKKVEDVILNAVGITFFFSFISTISIVSIWGDYLSSLLFIHNKTFLLIFLLITISSNALLLIWLGIFNGFQAYNAYVKGNIINAVIGLFILIFAIYLWGDRGIYIYILLSSFLSFIIYLFFLSIELHKKNRFPSFKKNNIFSRIDLSIIKVLLSYGATIILIAISAYLTQFIIRSFIIKKFSIEANGLYQSSYGFIQQYSTILQGIILAYLFPKLNSTDEKSIIEGEIDNATRYCILILVPLTLFVITFREYIITFFYSEKFLEASSLFPYQAAADLILMLSFSMGCFFLVKDYRKIFFLLGIVPQIAILIFTPLFVSLKGLEGIPIAYLVAYLLNLFLIYFFYCKKIGFALSSENKYMIILSLLFIFIFIYLDKNTIWISIIKLILFLLWLYSGMKTEDWKKLFKYIKDLEFIGRKELLQ